ncbi:MAG: acetyl-CoA C-acetyltransferase [Oscillospiraceae bacterium]|nr:acetyl-CoA C-acetyltransferase [Oscillospiraceae bacterium]
MDIYLVSCCRTAIGNFGGSLKDVPAAKLGEITAKAAIERAGIKPSDVDEVIFGCVLTAGIGQNVARQVLIGAGIPIEVTATTIDMVCGSGMKTVVDAARTILSGDAQVVLTGGTENMSLSPYAMPAARYGARMGDATLIDTLVHDGLTDVFNNYHMGITAENVCDKWCISRSELDAFALSSQEKANAAVSSGRFDAEIVPVPVKVKRELVDFKVDEYPRATSLESLGKLPPAFKRVIPPVTKDDGRVTAGNSSGINDGAAAHIIASGEAVKRLGLKPLAKLVSWGRGGVDPSVMGTGPIPATRQALERAGLTIDDIGLVEANEAFAAQAIAVSRDLKFDMSKVNVNGGAIALGHPIGASGARIIVTLAHEMQRRAAVKYGLATLCIGGGMGIATIWERCD